MLRPPRTRSGAAAGFTLTDLVIALMMIALVAAVAIPSFFDRAEVTLENAAVLLAKDLRSAQNRAAYLARDVEIVFDEDGGGYTIEDGLFDDETFLHRRYDRDAVFRGVAILDLAFTGGDALAYEARGFARTGARITLGYKGDRRVVRVVRGSGELVIDGSTSGWTDDGY